MGKTKKTTKKMAKAPVKTKDDFLTRWEKKSPEDKKWNLLQVGWMVGAIIIAFASLVSLTATIMTAIGAGIILFCLREINKMKGRK